MDSKSIFLNNLRSFAEIKMCHNYSELGECIGVNVNTLKGWMANNRAPRFSTLDSIADTLKIDTSDLINPNFSYSPYSYTQSNNSMAIFRKNLQVIFIHEGCRTWAARESLLCGLVSSDALKSYNRSVNPRSPSLAQLDLIASALGIKSYELIKMEYQHEKRNRL